MPEWLAVVLLGVLEGVTEFLPISSTGHLLLVENQGWLPRQSDVFNIVIQSGTAVAVLAAFTGRLRALADLRDSASRTYLAKLALAFVLTGLGGLLAKRAGFQLPKSIAPVAWATLLGGVVIIVVERWLRGRPSGRAVTWTVAVAVGVGQLVAAVFPGTSRSAATIVAALVLGLGRPAATEFSFLVGVPTLLAAGVFELRHAAVAPGTTDWGLLALGTLVSAACAVVVVRWLLRFVQTHTFTAFGWYRVALGVAMLVLGVRSAP